jgi:phytoene dehydrogenase-like protein
VRLFEASDEVGGRVRTDRQEGFLLDRGFQVLLTAYPECRRQLDYEALGLHSFFTGALVRLGGRFHTVADPFRRPVAGLLAALGPIGSFGDKLRVARLRQRLLATDLEAVFSRPERTTQSALEEEGFSSSMIERFFRPFLGGVFLERDLETSSRMFEFVFKMFSSGATALPVRGMQSIPRHLADGLPQTAIRTSARVVEVRERGIRLEAGDWVEGDAVVLAMAPTPEQKLIPGLAEIEWRSTTCVYYSAPEPPVSRPILVLDGEGQGPVNNLCVPSQVSPAYAPEGRALVSATVIDPAQAEVPERDLDSAIRQQMEAWFGPVARRWELLRIYRIERALPSQVPPWLETPERPVRIGGRLYACGDHRDNASIQGAMVSGRRAAEAVLEDLGPGTWAQADQATTEACSS